ncbi:MAG: protein translocase subunit SecDF, partial [Planctomycetaceae bacterium]|nr:protein translocase subunit SecDF [Planctomycetaceae bacterium]
AFQEGFQQSEEDSWFQRLQAKIANFLSLFTLEMLLTVLLVMTPFAAFFLGQNVAVKLFRAKDLAGQFGLICFTIFLAVVVIGSNFKDGELQLTWGVDLRGGVILIYEVEDQEAQGSSVMQGMVESLTRRLNPDGLKEIVIRPYGDRQIEIIVPEADDIEINRIKAQITTAGVLEFHIVANTRDHADLIQQAREMAEGADRREREVIEPTGEGEPGKVIGKWVRLRASESGFFDEWQPGDLVRSYRDGRILTDSDRAGTEQFPLGVEILMFVSDLEDQVKGEHLEVVRPDNDEQMRPCISFGMNTLGADRMAFLTSDNLPTNDFHRRLGIVMDKDLESAPRIMSTIRDQGRITGDFTNEEVELIVSILRSGQLQTTLQENPISEDKIGATLGADTIQRGTTAIGLSLSLVLIFIVIYYKFAGVVACLALILNLLLIVSLMILLKAAVTLPGLAGLVLTVGMSVDANVLIFERIREELKKGAALRLAIRNGFSRATTTIVDANVTTLITAIILYAIGTDQVRGFAVTLILGIMMSMYTAIFCSRVVFNLWERSRRLKDLRMWQILGATQIDFIGKRSWAAVLSLLLITGGLVAVGFRGANIFDIDFLGGTSVTLLLNTKAGEDLSPRRDYTDSDEVRKIVREVLGKVRVDNGTVTSSLSSVEISEGEDENVAWKLDTSIPSEALETKRDDGTSLTRFTERPAGNEGVVSGVEFLQTRLKEAVGFGGGDQAQSAFARYQVVFQSEQFTETGSPEGVAPQTPTPDPAPADPAPAATEPTPPADGQSPPAQQSPAKGDGAARGEQRDRIVGLRRQGFVVAPAAAQEELEPSTAEEQNPSASAADAAANALGIASQESSEAGPPAGIVKTAGILSFGETRITRETLIAELMAAAQATNIAVSERSIEVAKAVDERSDDPEQDLTALDLNWDISSNKPEKRWQVTLELGKDDALTVVRRLEERIAEEPIWLSSSTIGGRVAGDMQAKAVVALLASLLGIVGYLWIRFQRVIFGLAAVVALVHDVLITLGAIALSAFVADYMGLLLIEEFKISLPMVAAFLTIVGYSLNDTIVVFDRIREVRGKSPTITEAMINTSINQTLGRTLLTSMTTLMVVVILYALGGAGIHGFAFALVIGVLVGTYSSIFVASPALLWMANRAVAKGETV